MPGPEARGGKGPGESKVKRARNTVKIILLSATAIILASCAGYRPEPLTKAQIAGEAAFTLLHVMDWGQTLKTTDDPDYYEATNLLLGKDPSRGSVNLVMGAGLVLHPVVTYILPSKYRWWWIGPTTAAQAGLVIHNHSIGLGWGF